MVENNYQEIITADLRRIAANSLIPENGTIASVSEISRRTMIPATKIVSLIADGVNINNTQIGINQDLKTLNKPKPSKTADRIRARIQNERQRYQRRGQFPGPNALGKPTSKNITRKVVNIQITRAKIVLSNSSKQTKPETVYEKTLRLKQESRFYDYSVQNSANVEAKLAQSESTKLMRIWESQSVVPLERPDRIRKIIENSISTQQPIEIVNWICPAGTKLDFSPTGDTFQRYTGVSMETSFVNDHRLHPRLWLEKRLTRSFRRIDNLPQPMYLKIVADDNPPCLSPYCFGLDGEKPTMNAINEYANYAQKQLNVLVGQDDIMVSTFSSLLGPRMFREFVETFKRTSYDDIAPYLPPNVIENELRIAKLHMKVDDEFLTRLDGYVKKVLRQYAVEGLYLYKLFGDNMIMAWNESTTRTQTMDSLRKKLNLPTIPKIFVLHEKQSNVIQDDC